jgi:5'-deoxynucleotidase YfbR-like HD superfamily hydrolase
MISAPLAPLWHAASVRRWHQNPALAHTHQTIADHQGRCVLLLLALHPAPSLALLRAVATHDIGERVAGDLSSDFKRAAPVLAARHAEVEADARAELFAPDWPLTEDEAAWVKLVDQLDAHCWCLAFAPMRVLPASGPAGCFAKQARLSDASRSPAGRRQGARNASANR